MCLRHIYRACALDTEPEEFCQSAKTVQGDTHVNQYILYSAFLFVCLDPAAKTMPKEVLGKTRPGIGESNSRQHR